jgi:hypothetical protein
MTWRAAVPRVHDVMVSYLSAGFVVSALFLLLVGRVLVFGQEPLETVLALALALGPAVRREGPRRRRIRPRRRVVEQVEFIYDERL